MDGAGTTVRSGHVASTESFMLRFAVKRLPVGSRVLRDAVTGPAFPAFQQGAHAFERLGVGGIPGQIVELMGIGAQIEKHLFRLPGLGEKRLGGRELSG